MLPSLPGVMARAWKENATHAPKLVLPVGADVWVRVCVCVCTRVRVHTHTPASAFLL